MRLMSKVLNNVKTMEEALDKIPIIHEEFRYHGREIRLNRKMENYGTKDTPALHGLVGYETTIKSVDEWKNIFIVERYFINQTNFNHVNDGDEEHDFFYFNYDLATLAVKIKKMLNEAINKKYELIKKKHKDHYLAEQLENEYKRGADVLISTLTDVEMKIESEDVPL